MYKAPLHIFVVWHSKFKDGQTYAENIYSRYTRNITQPLSRGIGIPVFYRSKAVDSNEPLSIDLKEAENNAIVLLVDDEFIVNWKGYANKLIQQVDPENSSRNRIFAVSISANFTNLGKAASDNNFIRLHDVKGDVQEKSDYLLSQLSHELCRILLDKPRIEDKYSKTPSSQQPVNLFISHAKRDGAKIAEQVKKFIDANKPIKTFFDKIDIAPGFKFEDELQSNIEKSALLVIQTDSYSSREWCRWEVLRAKKADKPVVVVNAIDVGEERSFPYLGNVPTIRWKNPSKNNLTKHLEKIVSHTIEEILRYTYIYRYITNIKGLTSITHTRTPKTLSSAPELLTLLEKAINSSTKGKIIIYPDPPLTAEEMNLLSEVSEEYSYLTPTLLLAHQELNAK